MGRGLYDLDHPWFRPLWRRVLVAGTALGVIYVGAGRRVAVSLPARLTFELGVLVLVWQRLV